VRGESKRSARSNQRRCWSGARQWRASRLERREMRERRQDGTSFRSLKRNTLKARCGGPPGSMHTSSIRCTFFFVSCPMTLSSQSTRMHISSIISSWAESYVVKSMVDEEENQCAAARDETNAPGLRQARGSIALPRTAVNIVTARRCAGDRPPACSSIIKARNIYTLVAGLEASPHFLGALRGVKRPQL
jgi:hypothetical protein